MVSLHFVVAVFLVVGAAEINAFFGFGKRRESPAWPSKTVVRTDIKGRLLSVEEGCGYSKVANKRIVGGAPAKVGAWPWIALVISKNETDVDFDCGGSLITSRHVLSAAHCERTETNGVPYLVRLGEHRIGSTRYGLHEDIAIVRFLAHKEFDNVLWINDIAMIYLERDVEFTDRISPICLPFNDELRYRSYVGTSPFVAGWGLDQEEDGIYPEVLQQVQVPVIDNKQCKKNYEAIGEICHDISYGHRVLCAGYENGGKDACNGDSGGPLMLPLHENGRFPFYQIGIVSYGTGCARRGVPGVYANIPFYYEWIEEHLKLNQ